MINRIRRAETAVFCAWAVFVVAGLLFQKLSEYDDFTGASQTYPVIGASYVIIGVGALVALLAVLAGGLPLALSALAMHCPHGVVTCCCSSVCRCLSSVCSLPMATSSAKS